MDSAGKIIRIKEAIKSNFDASPDHYQAFEDRHRFFRRLNRTLLSAMRISAGADILDVGCGTGVSSRQLLDDVPACRVWGLDNSQAMLQVARSRFPESGRLRFVEGDAGRLTEHFHFRFDAIIYSASIFLIPDYRESLRQAKELLKEHGTVGVSFMDGVYDSHGANLLAIAGESAQLKVNLRKPVELAEFAVYFAEIFGRHTSWTHDFRMTHGFLREFFSIPAMSAGLFPGLPYAQRVKSVSILFNHLPDGRPLFRWRLTVGTTG
jgi:ubiquinone/menaquinone biosynthesis C-methylase UbiE